MHYGGCSHCHYPVYASYGCGYGYPVSGIGFSFPLIVVLFILLIIIGASRFGGR